MKVIIKGRGELEAVGSRGLALVAPGMSGTAESLSTAESSNRSGGRNDMAIAVNTFDGDITLLDELQIELSANVPDFSADSATRGDISAGAPALHIDTWDDKTRYAVLYTDEVTGACTWLFSNVEETTDSRSRLVFPLPEILESELPGSESTAAESDRRGLITKSMRALVKVVAWITDPLLGAAANAVAKAWEDKRRPYALYQVAADGTFHDADWTQFTDKPVLLLIHGTFSTPDAGFAGWLGSPGFKGIHDKYAGRCLALAHPTLHVSPDENVAWLLDNLPKGRTWAFDTISHSRGGLVVRSLAARGSQDHSCVVRRMVIVASPNFGTPLADAKRWTTFLNAHTNLLTALPDSVATVVAEGVLCLVKIVGSAAAGNLPGLAAMNSGEQYLRELANRAVETSSNVYAISAEYSPAHDEVLKQLIARGADAAVNSFFAEPNDLVVPTLGCSEGPYSATGFPVKAEQSMRLQGAVNHSGYFQDARVHRKLTEWLG